MIKKFINVIIYEIKLKRYRKRRKKRMQSEMCQGLRDWLEEEYRIGVEEGIKCGIEWNRELGIEQDVEWVFRKVPTKILRSVFLFLLEIKWKIAFAIKSYERSLSYYDQINIM